MASPHVSDDESSPPSSTRDPTQSRVAFQSFLSSFNTSDTHVATLRDIVLTQQQVDVLITNVAASEGHVTEFGISGCGIPISSLSALGTALTTLPSLTHVAIEDNAMGNAGVKALCDTMVECKSLQSWGLWKNGITSVGMASIATFLSHHPLLTLDLSVNSLGPAGAELIARILSDDPPLQHLFLANNEIGSAGTIALAQSLTLNKHLLTLGLQWNRIDENGGEALGKALMTNNTLEKLDLRWNSLGRVGNDAILAAATHNTTLTFVSLCGHATSESSNLQSALNLLCQRNITRKQPAHDSADGSNGNVSISPSMPSTSPRNIPRAISPSLSSTRYRDSLSHVILQQEREIARQAHHIARLEKRHTLNPVKKRMIRTTTMVSPHTHTHTHTHTTQHHRTLSPAGMTLPPPATSSTIASAIAASTTTTSAATSTSTSTATPTSTSTSTSPSTSTIPASPKQIPASPKQAPMVPPKKKQSLPAASLGLPPAPPSTSASAPSSTHVTPRPSSSSPSPSASTPQRTLQLQTHHEDTSGDVIGLSLSSIPLTARAAINILSMPHVFTCHISNNKRVDRIIFYRSSGELGALVWTDTTTTTLPLSSITSLHHGQSHPHLFTPHTDERCCITILSSTTPLCLSAETSDDALSWLHALLYIIIASGRTVSLSTFKHPGSSFTSQQYTVHPLSKAHIPSSPSTHPHSPSPRPSSPFESDDEHESSLASHVNLELAQSIIVLETEVARLTTALQQSQKEENIYDSRARQLTMERDIAMIRTLSLDEVRTLCAGQKACIERMEEEMRTLKAQVAQLQSELTSTRSTAATTQATLESRLANAEQQLQIARTKLSILKTSTNIDDLNDKDVAALDAQVHRISLPRSRTGSSDLAARRAMFEASASSAVATSAAPLPASPMKNRGSV